jgi:hypothetical protein
MLWLPLALWSPTPEVRPAQIRGGSGPTRQEQGSTSDGWCSARATRRAPRPAASSSKLKGPAALPAFWLGPVGLLASRRRCIR